VMSEGERQQVQLARSLMLRPELLVLDEPAAGLDLGARERLVGRMAAVAADPSIPAMVLVTHHVEEIPAGMTHALLLRSGSVIAQGAIADVLTSANVSATFDLDVTIETRAGRFSARLG
jgi:iron complex transport system ATP-binding protein